MEDEDVIERNTNQVDTVREAESREATGLLLTLIHHATEINLTSIRC